MSTWRAGYVHLLPEPRPEIVRTVSIGDDAMIDVDADGRLVGIEWLDDGDWAGVLAAAAMSGKLRMA